MAIIEVTALSKYYGKYMSIEQVSFAVEKGEIFGIVGGEDAGKTTVLDIVAGAVKPTSGSCKVCGLDVQSNAQQVARMIRVISQTGETYSRLRAKTVDKYFKGISADAARQRAQRWCAYFGIESSEVIRKMSKQKKTALYMIDVLLGMPRILMLDNPFDGADQDFIGRMTQFLRNENKRGLTVVLTAREESQIAHLCSRIVHMNEGRMQEAAGAAQDPDDFVDDDLMQYAQEAQRYMHNEPEKEDPFPQQDFAPEDNAPGEDRPQEQMFQQPSQQQFAPREPYAQQPYRQHSQQAYEQAPQQPPMQAEDPEFAQMRRDFYAQNTVRQPQVQPTQSQSQGQPQSQPQSQYARANSDDMFRRLEEDFFDPRQQEYSAPYAQQRQQQQDFSQTRRISMPQTAYAMREFAPQVPAYEQDTMQQTRSIPRFDASYSRPYAQAEAQSDRFAEYAAPQRAYEPYNRAGAHAAAQQARDFEEYESSYQPPQARHAASEYRTAFEAEPYRAAEPTRFAYDYRMQEAERTERPAHAKHAAYESPYEQEPYRAQRREEPRFEEPRRQEVRREEVRPEEDRRASHAANDFDAYGTYGAHAVSGSHVKQEAFDSSSYTSQRRTYEPQESRGDDFYQSRESRTQNTYSEAAGAHSRYSAEYEPVRGAHVRTEEKATEPAYEGKHARPAHSADVGERTQSYSRYTQQENTRSQGAHAANSASHAKEDAAYPLYSSHHNASVHMPSSQGNRRISLVADNVPMEFLRNIGATGLHQDGDRVEFFFNGQMDKLIVALSQMSVRDLRVSLDVPVSNIEQE